MPSQFAVSHRINDGCTALTLFELKEFYNDEVISHGTHLLGDLAENLLLLPIIIHFGSVTSTQIGRG